jgi:hypothetical protein
MFRKGYLDQQIEELGRVMAKLLTDMTGQKSGESADAINEMLQNELNLNIEDLTSMPDEAIIETLTAHPKFDTNNLERLGDIFATLAQSDTSNKPLFQKSLVLYRHVDVSGKIFSVERNAKIDRIKKLLETD